jgi:hypothetical protein
VSKSLLMQGVLVCCRCHMVSKGCSGLLNQQLKLAVVSVCNRQVVTPGSGTSVRTC